MAGRGWKKWHWRMPHRLVHVAGWSQWKCELQGQASALAASASVSFGGESAHPALPYQTVQDVQAGAVP